MKEHDLLEDVGFDVPTGDEKTLATIAHLGVFAGAMLPFLGNIFVPLIIWLLKREESGYIAEHAKEALNFQITVVILGAIAGVLCFVLIGIPILIIIGILDVALSIGAAIKANRGEMYEYPLNFRLVK